MRSVVERLFRRLSHPPVAPWCPQGLRIYCVGDIHGRADLLQQLHSTIRQDAADYSGRKKVIYLGDYIDRGEESKRVIEHLLEQPLSGFEEVYLRGNHEQSMLDFLERPEVGQAWLSYGGLATLASYGVRAAKLPARYDDHVALQQDLAERIPENHLLFLQGTSLSHSSGSYYFVHAGIRPGTPLDRQLPEDQLWIRDEFLSHRRHFERIIVHGHNVTDEPDMAPNRIGIDTGAYLSGKLTALVLEESELRFIQT